MSERVPVRSPAVDAVSDDELLARWSAGDRLAGGELFDRYFCGLTRFFRNKVGDAMDDLIGQTMLQLVEARPAYRGSGSFRSFVFGVAYNVLRSHHRRVYRHDAMVDFGVTSLHDLGAGPEAIAAAAAEQQLVLQALRRLPVDHQVLLELFYFEELTAGEIAAVLDAPEGTIRTRIRRARLLLEQAVASASHDRSLLDSTVSRLDDWARSIRALSRAPA